MSGEPSASGARAGAHGPPSSSSPSSSSSSEDSDDSESDSDVPSTDIPSSIFASDSDEGEKAPPPVARGLQTHVRDKAKNTDNYSRFDPGVGEVEEFHLPNQGMIDYVAQRFSSFVSEKKVKETITDDYPTPSGVPALNVPKVDDYVSDIFLARKSDYGKHVDENWCRAQSRITDIMGPLSKLWAMLENVREDDTVDFELFDGLDLVEKIITLVGLTHQTVSYYRRQNITFKWTKDMKKAKSLLKQRDTALAKDNDKLFGKAFYRKLVKSAKIRKETRNISSQLGESKGKSHKNSDNKQYQGGRGRGNPQPFQEGPSPGGRGGGRKVNFSRRGRGSNRGKSLRKVGVSRKVNLSRPDRQTDVCTKVKKVKKDCSDRKSCRDRGTKDSYFAQSARTTVTIQSFRLTKFREDPSIPQGSELRHSGPARKSGGEVKVMPEQLADPNPGPSCPSSSEGVKNPLYLLTCTGETNNTIFDIPNRLDSDRVRDYPHVGERGYSGGDSNQTAVCQSIVLGPQEGRITETCHKPQKSE